MLCLWTSRGVTAPVLTIYMFVVTGGSRRPLEEDVACVFSRREYFSRFKVTTGLAAAPISRLLQVSPWQGPQEGAAVPRLHRSVVGEKAGSSVGQTGRRTKRQRGALPVPSQHGQYKLPPATASDICEVVSSASHGAAGSGGAGRAQLPLRRALWQMLSTAGWWESSVSLSICKVDTLASKRFSSVTGLSLSCEVFESELFHF